MRLRITRAAIVSFGAVVASTFASVWDDMLTWNDSSTWEE